MSIQWCYATRKICLSICIIHSGFFHIFQLFFYSWLSNAHAAGGRTLYMVLVVWHLDFGFLPAYGWLPFLLTMASPVLICLSLSVSIFQLVATSSLTLIQKVNSQCHGTICSGVAQSSKVSRGLLNLGNLFTWEYFISHLAPWAALQWYECQAHVASWGNPACTWAVVWWHS